MADSAPRHLAEPPRRFGMSPLQQVFLAAMLSLAAITAVVALLARDAGNGGRRAAAPATTRAQPATTATTAPATTTTAAAATRPVRPTPGNLLADGDFERDLAGWAPLGGARVERVEGGASGRWAAAVTPGGGGDGRPGMVRRDAATAEAGTTYEAVFWVNAPEGGQVVLALRELAGGREVSADVEHHTAAPGSSLALEVVGHDLPGDGRLLVDGIDLQTE